MEKGNTACSISKEFSIQLLGIVLQHSIIIVLRGLRVVVKMNLAVTENIG